MKWEIVKTPEHLEKQGCNLQGQLIKMLMDELYKGDLMGYARQMKLVCSTFIPVHFLIAILKNYEKGMDAETIAKESLLDITSDTVRDMVAHHKFTKERSVDLKSDLINTSITRDAW